VNYTDSDIDAIEDWWIQKARKNFLAYRMFIRCGDFTHNWFVDELCRLLQQFYQDLKNGLRPVLLIQTPPQHGKSIAVADFVSWVSGLMPKLKTIYATYSDILGVRCNTYLQRTYDSEKYQGIFPGFTISKSNVVTQSSKMKRNSTFIEHHGDDGQYGFFRNTTVQGPVTGETLDLGIIDDAVKGREQANSPVYAQKTWEWFTDDFFSRFSEYAGLLVIMTRWTTTDIIAKIIEKKDVFPSKITVVNFPAIATDDDENRKVGEPLFPGLKSKTFLMGKKAVMFEPNWEALYQGNPTVSGGNLFKDSWWQWYDSKEMVPLKYKFIVGDTAQKEKEQNDWTVLQCWGMGIDGKIRLLDKVRARFDAPTLRVEAEAFYRKHNVPKQKVDDPTLRGMYIEDKSSGTGLIQELRKKGLNVVEVPRNKDKVLRGQDAAPYIKSGLVLLNTGVPDIGNTTKEAREFPNSAFDDDIDTLISAVEITYINETGENLLLAAMEAE